MSKVISVPSLTALRERFSEEINEDSLRDTFSADTFDFQGVELLDAPEFPELSEGFIESFYTAFAANPRDEFELARLIYEEIRITRQQASNNLFWVYVNLNYFFAYIKARWIKKFEDDPDDVNVKEIDRFFLALESSQNSLMKSPIAGLWWAIELTIDESFVEDKYKYTKLFLSERNLRDKNLGTYQFIRTKSIFQALLDFYEVNKDGEWDGERIGSEAIAQQMSKLLNQIGGLTLLSYLTKEEILELLNANLNIILQRANATKVAKTTSRKKIQAERNPENIDANEGDVTDCEELDEVDVAVEVIREVLNAPHYFQLNDSTGDYKIGDQVDVDCAYNVPIDTSNGDCFLIHFYEEGKIKKSNLSNIREKIQRGCVARNKVFQNGKSNVLTLHSVTSVHEPVLFGISFMLNGKLFVKLMDAQDADNFRTDNFGLNQEGKKILYMEGYSNLMYKIIPVQYSTSLERLISEPGARGANIKSTSYIDERNVLLQIWPELFA